MIINLLNNHRLIIKQDENADSPNDWGNDDIFLVYDHRQFNIEREGFEPKNIYQYLIDNINKEENTEYDDYVIFNVNAYIHSGVSLSLNYPASSSNDFDTSTTGFILINKDAFKESTDKLKEEEVEMFYIELAEGLIQEWNTYLIGNIYKFRLEKLIPYRKVYLNKLDTSLDEEEKEVFYDSEEIESCGNFYIDNRNFTIMLAYINEDLWDKKIEENLKNLDYDNRY